MRLLPVPAGKTSAKLGNVLFEYDFNYAQHVRLMYRGCYEPLVVRALRAKLRPGDVFVDVGANIGYLSGVAASAVGTTGKVYAFEPSKREFERLETLARLNPEFTIQCIRNGCSDQESFLEMDISSVFGWNTFVPGFMRPDVYQKKEKVRVIRLDDFLLAEAGDLKKIKMIKIDTEGYEWFVLRGLEKLFARVKPLVLCEITPRAASLMGKSTAELEAWMQTMGYKAVSVIDFKTPVSLKKLTTPDDVLFVPA